MRRGKLHNEKATDYDNYITVAEPGDQPDQGGPGVLQAEFGKAGGGRFPLLRQMQGYAASNKVAFRCTRKQ
jgi:hypothetical protein